jgi:phosphohistidine phosphatase SixA
MQILWRSEMNKKISCLLSLTLFSLIVFVHQVVKAEGIKEDCLAFNPENIAVKNIQGHWKIVNGSHWILDFPNQAEADQSFQAIKKYSFDGICFVGRPDPSMTYFTTKKKATTVAIIRHAEKKDNSANPPLTKAGECRAESLARILKNSGISVVFSTPLTRTQETVNNYADSQSPKITIQSYQTPKEVANLIKTKYTGKSILVASHSGDVEQIVQELGAGLVPSIGNEFNNLFIVTIPPNGTPSVMPMKYEIWFNVLSQMDCKD